MKIKYRSDNKTTFEKLPVGAWFSHEPNDKKIYMKTDQPDGIGCSITPDGCRRTTDAYAEVYERHFKLVEI